MIRLSVLIELGLVVDKQRQTDGHEVIAYTALAQHRALKTTQPPVPQLHRESKKGATFMAITLSVLDRFAKFFHCCKEK